MPCQSLLNLPHELIVHVLSFLTPCERGPVASVCKALHASVQQPQLWREVNLSNVLDLSGRIFRDLITRSSNVVSIVMPDVAVNSPAYLVRLIGRYCPNLEHLDLGFHIEINKETEQTIGSLPLRSLLIASRHGRATSIANVVRHLPNLEKFECPIVSPHLIETLLEHCVNLKSLSLSTRRRDFPNLVHRIAKALPRLEALSLNIPGFIDVDPISCLGQLKHLDLAGSRNLSPQQLCAALSRPLESLSLAMTAATSEVLEKLAQVSPNMQSLDLQYCPQIDSVFALKACSQLQEVSLRGCVNILESDLSDFLLHQSSLARVDVSWTSASREMLIQCVPTMTSLEVLTAECATEDPSFIPEICSLCPHLQAKDVRI